MSIAKIQAGDKVKIIAGKYRGTVGIVKKVYKQVDPKKSKRISVSGVPGITKYRRSFTYDGQTYPGAKYTIDRTMDISNVMLVDAKGQSTRTRIEIKDNKKARVYLSDGKAVAKHQIPAEETNTNELSQ